MTAPAGGSGSEPVRLVAWVHGVVHGVGFRWWTRSRALELGLLGWAKNLPDGRVEVVAEGAREDCRALLDHLGSSGTPGRVDRLSHRFEQARGGLTGFTER